MIQILDGATASVDGLVVVFVTSQGGGGKQRSCEMAYGIVAAAGTAARSRVS